MLTPEEPRRLTVEIRGTTPRPQGVVIEASGRRYPFEGWLELLRALEVGTAPSATRARDAAT